MRYKKSDIQQTKEVSAMLAVLPKQMNEIRESEDRMLSEEPPKKIDVVTSEVSEKVMATPVAEHKSFIVDKNKHVDLHVPVSDGFYFRNLQGLVNIYLHFHSK